jgi:hypothetical protein
MLFCPAPRDAEGGREKREIFLKKDRNFIDFII